MRVRYLDPARAELLEAVEYYERQNATLGGELLLELEHVISMLRHSPELGAKLDARVRRVLLRRFPYRVVYTVEGEELVVVAFAHLRRRPDYWTDRLES